MPASSAIPSSAVWPRTIRTAATIASAPPATGSVPRSVTIFASWVEPVRLEGRRPSARRVRSPGGEARDRVRARSGSRRRRSCRALATASSVVSSRPSPSPGVRRGPGSKRAGRSERRASARAARIGGPMTGRSGCVRRSRRRGGGGWLRRAASARASRSPRARRSSCRARASPSSRIPITLSERVPEDEAQQAEAGGHDPRGEHVGGQEAAHRHPRRAGEERAGSPARSPTKRPRKMAVSAAPVVEAARRCSTRAWVMPTSGPYRIRNERPRRWPSVEAHEVARGPRSSRRSRSAGSRRSCPWPATTPPTISAVSPRHDESHERPALGEREHPDEHVRPRTQRAPDVLEDLVEAGQVSGRSRRRPSPRRRRGRPRRRAARDACGGAARTRRRRRGGDPDGLHDQSASSGSAQSRSPNGTAVLPV